MNKALPKIKETKEEIRGLLKSEKEVKRRNRLQAVYLIVTKQVKSRGAVAKLLGVNRNTISDWLSVYEEKGLEGLLKIHRPSGAKPKITAAAVEEIKKILRSENGFRTYREIHEMIESKHQIKVSYAAVHYLVRYKLEAKAKSPRPSHPKKTKRK